MNDALYSIGDLSRLSDVRVATIRYYEQVGLMPPPPRTAGRQRRYGAAHLDRLRFIRQARHLGFGMNDVGELLRLAGHPEAPCAAADALAAKHLHEVEYRIAQLVALRGELERMLAGCHGSLGECRIIEAISAADQLTRSSPPN